MNLMEAVANKLSSVFDNAENKNIRRSDIVYMLEENAKMHMLVSQQLIHGIGDKDYAKWFIETAKPAMKNSKTCANTVYDSFFGELRGAAKNQERKCPFTSLREANAKMDKILRDVVASINNTFEEPVIDIHDAKISQLSLIGLIKESDNLINFSVYLYSLINRLPVDDGKSIPRYRENFLKENVSAIAKNVSEICDGKGIARFADDLKRTKLTGADVTVGIGGSFNFNNTMGPQRFIPSIADRIANVLHCLNIFAHIADYIDDHRLRVNRRNREIKEWLEQHNAILKLDLSNMDKTSPEYAKLMNIIKAYDEKIAEYDQKIREFEEE